MMPTSTPTQTLWTEIAGIIGTDHLRAANEQDGIDGMQPQMIAEPGSAEEVAAALRWANESGAHVIPRGSGTKLSWGNRPRAAELIISTARLNRVVEHAHSDLTATVEAGCTVQAFQDHLAQHGQRLALDPLWPQRATIGGILATNDGGSLRVRYGALRDLIIGATIALPDGTLAKSGGKVVKNVAGYDLQKLMTGSFGTLGIITQAIFRLYPLPKQVRTFSFSSKDVEAANQLIHLALDSTLAYTGVQMRCGSDEACEIDVRLEGVPDALDAQAEQLRRIAEWKNNSEDTWTAGEQLFAEDKSATAVVLKINVLPSQLALVAALARNTAEELQLHWKYVAQATGIGFMKLYVQEATGCSSTEKFLSAIIKLRAEIEARKGSLVVSSAPGALKARLDVWGASPDSIELMRRIKEQFDPAGILNPGRFVGGI